MRLSPRRKSDERRAGDASARLSHARPCGGKHSTARRLRRAFRPALGQARARLCRGTDPSFARALLSPTALAREYTEADLSPAFKANGSTDPGDPVYKAHAANGFADWKLGIRGLVEQALE